MDPFTSYRQQSTDFSMIVEDGTFSTRMPSQTGRTVSFTCSDWAAPGSCVFEEDDIPPATRQTSAYAASLWATSTVSPLMDDHDAKFHEALNEDDAAAVAAAAVAAAADLDNTPPLDPASHPMTSMISMLPMSGGAGLSRRGSGQSGEHFHVHQPYAMANNMFMVAPDYTNAAYHVDPQMQLTVHPRSPKSVSPPFPSSPSSHPLSAPPIMSHMHPQQQHHHQAHHPQQHLPSFDDEHIAQSIIYSAGLPLSLTSLLHYIKDGQPQTGSINNSKRNHHRNFPNQNEPPVEDLSSSSQTNRRGNRNRRASGSPRGADVSPTSPNTSSASGGGFRVTSDESMSTSTRGARPKSESEVLSDLLHFHANFFPPPPPPRVPVDERRQRAALWYHYAIKWDITHRLPPPPRTPLPEMCEEQQMMLPELTRVPYYGDDWLMKSERWFAVMQELFDYPEENTGVATSLSLVLQEALIST